MPTVSNQCPCGTTTPYDACCGPAHAGTPAPTAEALMRSRYAAFALGDVDYLLRTWHPTTRPETLTLDPAQRWTSLTIVTTTGGGFLHTKGTVEFTAHYTHEGRPGTLHEVSRFVRESGRWLYVTGEVS
ncbi:YchJ family protein [Actinokineospora auranticolor]|uniref:UPF0225 protein CLV40_11441 n=1 Tax=Actinokineospora auranticolor TaxID=155976 RepID=A0A2S6GJJ5_9PSEU|nr:YchJ family protein [Actinokineospora auranticolor]PPK65389.1 SEC-C motif-containing protein [Actinokineospora auranticolor]